MTSGSPVVKVTAKTALKGKWLNSVIVTSIFLFSVFIVYNVSSVFSVVAGDLAATVLLLLMGIFAICQIVLGTFRYFWRILFDADDNPISVFYYFSNKTVYKRAVSLIVSIGFRALLFGLLFNIPTFIVEAMTHSFLYELIGLSIPVWAANLTNVTVFLKVLSSAMLFFVMVKFYIAPVLLVADDNMESAEAIHMSSVISKKTSIDFIYLALSFAGWIIASLFVVPLIFTIPYITTSYLVHVRFAIAEYNIHIESLTKQNYPSFTV